MCQTFPSFGSEACHEVGVFFLISISAVFPAFAAETAPPLQTIQSLDVPRYMGTWFEIAKYPNRFQKQCVRNTSAEYSLQKDGTVKVLNRCQLASGDMDEAEGQARQIGGLKSPKLEVRFAPAWLSWLPMVWGKYWVIDLDPEYQLVAVSEPSREYLWVLARTQQVDKAKYNALLQRLKAKGFDLNKLELSPQGS